MPMKSTLLISAISLGATLAFAPLKSSRVLSRGVLFAPKLFSELEDADVEELETRKEGEMLAKKLRSNMYNEQGVAYAPWMVNQIDEEAYEAAKMMRKQRKMRQNKDEVETEGAYFNTDLQADELSGQGLKIKMVGDEVELIWRTAGEVCLGYKVQKRLARTPAWDTVSSYEDWGPLQSKGTAGGTYSFLDPTSTEGDWIYRIVDVEEGGKSTVLCQAMIEVQSKGEKLIQTGTLGAFALLFAGFIALGMNLDPVQNFDRCIYEESIKQEEGWRPNRGFHSPKHAKQSTHKTNGALRNPGTQLVAVGHISRFFQWGAPRSYLCFFHCTGNSEGGDPYLSPAEQEYPPKTTGSDR
eukprot:CAMPEP_0171908116 /NCGR_PEP_ID=MMETSP0993-20121228/7561_1 /TAXON_ID=483369 /ORGANISM="non described non described, Strain CCMP2098" /LENGTH=353 /DNA_ID=CAMNT_0012540591 /DNA_START=86 /DNA_END=1145 /DNA_ORIENTATION=+